MKLREALAILFCWIFVVLLVYQTNQPNTFYYTYEKSYTVSQDGVGTDYSLETFSQVSGPHPDTTYYFFGTFNMEITVGVDGEEGRPVVLDGQQGYFDEDPIIVYFFNKENEEWEPVPEFDELVGDYSGETFSFVDNSEDPITDLAP